MCVFGDSTFSRSVSYSWATLYTVHRVGHVAVRVQWPGVVVRVALRVVCGGGRGGAENGAPLGSIYGMGVSSNHPQWRPRTDESQNGIARETATRPEGAHGRKDHVESVRAPPPSLSQFTASTATAKTRSSEGSQGWKITYRELARCKLGSFKGWFFVFNAKSLSKFFMIEFLLENT